MVETAAEGHARDPSSRAFPATDNDIIEPDPNPGDVPSFTFITHNDELQSKRIRDATARKQIRSHVMRDVRRRERIAGLRRPSKKERGSKVTQPSIASSKETIFELGEPSQDIEFEDESFGEGPEVKTTFDQTHAGPQYSSNSSIRRSPSDVILPKQHGPMGMVKRPSIPTAPSLDLDDPFGTLPYMTGTPRLIDRLLKHLFQVFIPITFPMEQKSQHEIRVRQDMIMLHHITNSATFYGAMAVAAAHRGRISANWEDPIGSEAVSPEYLLMHDRALRTLNRRMQDPDSALDADNVNGVMMLIGATLINGHYAELKLHLDGLVKMSQLRGLRLKGASSPQDRRIIQNTLLFDVKTAVGMGTRPLFPLPIQSTGLDETLRQRVSPPPSSDLCQFATKFRPIPDLCPTLLNLIEGTSDIFFLNEYNFTDAHGLSTAEHELARWRVLTLEHALLEYAYRQFPTSLSNELEIPFIEAITRLTALRFLSSIGISTGPNTGLSRSFSKQICELLEPYSGQYSQFSAILLELLTWVICLNIQSAFLRRDQEFLYEQLRQIGYLRSWRDWDEFHTSMKGFLFVPRLWDTSWKKMWDRVQNQNLEIPPRIGATTLLHDVARR